MSKSKIGIVAAIAVVAGLAIVLVLQQGKQRQANEEKDALLRQQVQRANQLAAENEALLKQAARAGSTTPASNNPSMELLRLRGETARLRRENEAALAAKTNGPSALSGLKANPEMWKAIRDQQKMGLNMIYSELGKRLKLTKEQSGALNDVLADHVMENIDQITAILAEKKSPEQTEALLSAQEAALNEKVKALLGDDAYSQYQDYTKNLASFITAEQFKDKLTGESAEKDAKSKQLYQMLQDETKSTLANAGLAADYQLVPTFNFRNFASETIAEKNLSLLDGIYERVTVRAGNFLSPEDITSFGEFRALAIKNNRMALALNRKLMAPGGN